MIIVGDVHGCFDTLMELVKKFPKDQRICFVGDLIDRGPKSKDVVQWVKENGHDCVMGNHEKMAVEEGKRPRFNGIWLPNGGLQTLNSYKKRVWVENEALFADRTDERTLDEHFEWMADLPLYKYYPDITNEEGRCLVVSHSSIGKVWNWDEERKNTQKLHFESHVLWDRNPPKDAKDIYNIIGHTPVPFGPKIKSFYANVDTGAYAKKAKKSGYGFLSALQFPEMIVYTQETIDDWSFRK